MEALGSSGGPPHFTPLSAAWTRLHSGDAQGSFLEYARAGEAGWEIGSWNAAFLLEKGLLEGSSIVDTPQQLKKSLEGSISLDAAACKAVR